MGASKRAAELVLLALSGPTVQMNAIRLGNVLGSEGSVVPLFLEQIAGGWVTVTPRGSPLFPHDGRSGRAHR